MTHLRDQWRRVAGRYVFDVDYSTDKDTLMGGEITSGTRRVVVEADTETEARLIAEQMVACDVEPTGARRVAARDWDFGGDSSSGQYDGWVAAYEDGKRVGYLDYSIWSQEPDVLAIKMVEVEPEHRGKGIAGEMLDYVVRTQWTDWGKPVPTIHGGMLTEDGGKWWPSVRRRYKTAASIEVKTTPEVHDGYSYLGKPLRFYIEDETYKGDDNHPYHQVPGVVAWLDTFTTSDTTLIAYMTVTDSRLKQGLSRVLTQAVYDRFYKGDHWIDFGKIMSDEAEHLYRSFKERYPRTTGKIW